LGRRGQTSRKAFIEREARLSDAELIAILIATGSGNESAVDLSKRILDGVKGNLNELGKLSVTDLKKHKGIGEAKALSIMAALELGRRRQSSDILKKEKIVTSKDFYEFALPYLADLQHEAFLVVYCNRANAVIHQQIVSSGGVTGTVVDVKMILKEAIALEFGDIGSAQSSIWQSSCLRGRQESPKN
jgi:DNA repair protein RadC